MTLRQDSPDHWILDEFYAKYGADYDTLASAGDRKFPMEFPIPPAPNEDEIFTAPVFEDADVKEKDKALLEKMGFNPTQQEYLLTEPHYEQCWELDSKFKNCMENNNWKASKCKTLREELNSCWYR